MREKVSLQAGQTWGPFDALRVARHALDVCRVDRRGPLAVTARQSTRLAEAVAFARVHSPLSRELYAELPPVVTDVRQLPVVTKPALMDRFDDWVTDPAVTRQGVEAFLADLGRVGDLFLGRYVVWTTSGTTGRRGVFLHDRGALATYAALAVRRDRGLCAWAKRVLPALWQGVRFASVVATGGHFASAASTALAQKSFAWGRNQYRVFSVLDPLAKLVENLHAFQPTDVMGYPSALALLAREQQAGRLAIHPGSITSSSEGLEPSDRQLVAEAFGIPVQELYGASEFPDIAFDCPCERLHVNADWVILEPVDDHYRPVPPGIPSRTTLVTNLANRVAPLLRYDLGDSITWLDEPCPCGSRLPAIRVEGRRDDVLFLQTPAGTKVAVLPLALGLVVKLTPGVENYQVIQTGPAEVRIRLEFSAGAEKPPVWAAVVRRVEAFLATQGVPVVRVVRDPTPPGRDPRTGKFCHVWAAERMKQSEARLEVLAG